MSETQEQLIQAIAKAKFEAKGEGYNLPPPIKDFKKSVLVAIQAAERCLKNPSTDNKMKAEREGYHVAIVFGAMNTYGACCLASDYCNEVLGTKNPKIFHNESHDEIIP